MAQSAILSSDFNRRSDRKPGVYGKNAVRVNSFLSVPPTRSILRLNEAPAWSRSGDQLGGYGQHERRVRGLVQAARAAVKRLAANQTDAACDRTIALHTMV